LASGIHLAASLDHVPHDDSADFVRLETGALNGGTDGDGPQI
jgi:hypothetical protein